MLCSSASVRQDEPPLGVAHVLVIGAFDEPDACGEPPLLRIAHVVP
jgi:hypothetical protein